MRLIDADELKLRIDCHGTNKFWMLDEDIRSFIDEIPTVDAVEVVRCKDCKFYNKHGLFGEIQKWCKRLCDEFDRSMAIVTNDDDFCSYGERIEVQRNFNASNTLNALDALGKKGTK